MPTVAAFDGLRVAIYPNDHLPAHVHVVGSGCEAVFNLRCPHGPPEARESYGLTSRRIRRIRERLASMLEELCEAWEQIHG